MVLRDALDHHSVFSRNRAEVLPCWRSLGQYQIAIKLISDHKKASVWSSRRPKRGKTVVMLMKSLFSQVWGLAQRTTRVKYNLRLGSSSKDRPVVALG